MSKNLIPVQRRQQILEYLQQHHTARSSDLRDMFESSEATIRRDLEWLEKHGYVERTHGGAILVQRMQHEALYSASARAFPEEKRRIGILAASLVQNGETIFLNNGTTTTEVLLALQMRQDLDQLTVFTNNVSAAIAAQESPFEIILLGGHFRPRSHSLVGRFAADVLRQVFAHRVILGADGVGLRHGCTSPISQEAEIGRLMIERCLGPTMIVIDHSKWGVIAPYQVATIEQIDILVTDSKLPDDSHKGLEKLDIELLVAENRQRLIP
ncbi:MAG: DeoR/GlpR transcriptional regulator [Anaerolineales bacterium]|nr:DeoR/GlpR transcriptional regulator [Anaerolineales bacterium]